MRDVINKGLTNEELLRGVKSAYDQGWDRVKLYFMIGLPGETDLDVLGIAETVAWLQQECRAPKRKRLSITLTISNFTPKPHTPFQWHSVSTAEFQRKQELLRGEFRQMRGVKANFTDVRLSAMEDFLSRGDRQLSPVIRQAWKLGAGMDAWWESLEKAYQAWEEAIEDAGLTWKYRQITEGTWQALNRVDEAIESPIDRPLPWDHIDTGISKEWLKEDLQRALAEITVPDCSFDGCSHCGVCGIDFGHNIVVAPPPIPAPKDSVGNNPPAVQRLRVTFGKQGELSLLSHLDLLRLLDRAIRRASLPISYTNGFHPSPRISVANALSLGTTSSGELVDFELAETVPANEFLQRLSAQLPERIPLYDAVEVPLKQGSGAKLLQEAEYELTLDASIAISTEQWQEWIANIVERDEIILEGRTKSGKRKQVNLRAQLFELELQAVSTEGWAMLRYRGSCRNDGTMLRPADVVYLFEVVSGATGDDESSLEFQLRRIHRKQLMLSEPSAQ